jgi:hypothetical protein
VAVAQILARTGFEIRRHAISTLSLGELGWIQIANFALTGLLALACATGLRRVLRGGRGAASVPVLISLYGVGLIVGAIFHPDPGLGFPPGAPSGMPATMSPHASIHMAGFAGAFLSVVAACVALSRRFAGLGDRRWAVYSIATAIATPILVVLGSSVKGWVGVIFAIAGVVAFGWVSAISFRLMPRAE